MYGETTYGEWRDCHIRKRGGGTFSEHEKDKRREARQSSRSGSFADERRARSVQLAPTAEDKVGEMPPETDPAPEMGV